ncbi:hypothetical protein Pan241w_48920 [Gimesia alba]|uniref:Zinc ribbon domain protein n=1 Tax=Gimesia alba TaxID=2527973 RepID=A0A517RLL6_9PLAN|nr:hypothetical protein Pan241w_48920 [Gimesia alba]
MLVKQFKCQRCNYRFECEVIDRESPYERFKVGPPVRCPKCDSNMVEVIRVIRKAS